ncbi:RteC domain-containing protein [Autumnicola edwardsiae]|uniref:RteC domain-containing protein n=1 Tax=Autumnicola edwardsiae TaxID=3075594 RepID=A0ABU3CTR9_9FLAO|nr:RteC domain-containing protein [Zunongwangia sp. F297]MDT0649755.1 RteC domain-containing protein [Zunongwangia sp. F297]
MYLTNRINALKSEIRENITPGGSLHSMVYYLHSEYDLSTNVPTTNISLIKNFFQKEKESHEYYSYEILEGINYYIDMVVEDAENDIDKANLWEKFVHETDHEFHILDKFRVHYSNILASKDLKGLQRYRDRLWVEDLMANNQEEKILKSLKSIIHSLQGKQLFEENNLNEYRIQYFKKELEEFEDLKILENHKNPNKGKSKIKWEGTQTQLIELIKALIENGSVSGTQKEVIQNISQFFDVEIKYPDKIIQDIKNRNNDNETIFINDLKTSLTNYITKENRR